ncbi:MAG: methylenetetrahydrofolate reductase, partial [Bacteroidia bacterium]
FLHFSFPDYLCKPMHVIDHLNNVKDLSVSIEIIPPKRGGSVASLHGAIESILPFHPPFIDVTSHAAEVVWEEQSDGSYKRKVKRKSPGTFGLCAAIKYKYELEPVPHILCGGFTKEETEDALIELNYLGIENILAIRGDKANPRPVPTDRSENKYAMDLVRQVTDMNSGKYLDKSMVDPTPTNFCQGVSFYPEKHFEAPNLKFDLEILKKKQDAGAHYGVSQMFFDTQKYLDYVARAREIGVSMPLIPGMKIMTSKSHLTNLPAFFHIDLPEELYDRMMAAKTRKEEVQVGIDWAFRQCRELLDAGIPYLHFYIMQNTRPFIQLMKQLRKL